MQDDFSLNKLYISGRGKTASINAVKLFSLEYVSLNKRFCKFVIARHEITGIITIKLLFIVYYSCKTQL